MLTGLTQGFGRQREVHDNTKDVVGSARRQDKNSCQRPALKVMQNQPIPQRVQQDEVDAAATAYGPSMVVDKTHAGFGV
eukprot:5389187-Prymnesium_polylepis.2